MFKFRLSSFRKGPEANEKKKWLVVQFDSEAENYLNVTFTLRSKWTSYSVAESWHLLGKGPPPHDVCHNPVTSYQHNYRTYTVITLKKKKILNVFDSFFSFRETVRG